MRCIVVLLLIVFTLPALPVRVPSPTDGAGGREVEWLDGDWQCELDASGTLSHAAFTAALPHAETVRLPVCWSSDARTRDYHGAVWYAHPLTFPAAGNGAGMQLVIGNPVGIFELYLDDTLLAHGFGNGLTQTVALTGTPGSRHQLAIHLDAGQLPEALRRIAPGGIGPVRLETLPAVHFTAVTVRSRPTPDALEISYRLATDVPGQVRLIFRLLSLRSKHQLGTPTTITLDLPAEMTGKSLLLPLKHAAPWITRAAGSGNSYLLQAEVMSGKKVLDSYTTACGVCQVTADEHGLHVNGMPVALHGLRLHGGIPPMSRSTLLDTYRAEFTQLRQAGYTAIMADGTALPDEALTIADELGLMVIAEVPITTAPAPEHPDLKSASEPLAPAAMALDFARALEQQGHHPCIIAWSWASTGDPAQELATFRRYDAAHPALLRTPDGTRLWLPAAAEGLPVTNIDTLDDASPAATDLLWQAERLSSPLLVSGTALETAEHFRTQGMMAEERYALTIRQTVESARRALHPFGYFIRPLCDGSLTGLLPSDGAPGNSRAYFAALGYNQPRIIAVRWAPRKPPEVTLINDAGPTGDCALTRLLTRPNGLTEVTRSTIGHDVAVRGDRLQELSNELPPPQTPQAGEYRLQYILSAGSKIIALSSVVTLRVGE